ncbi:hypothetical protein SDRG_03454 [Saprolegnia diclina VS20]|uniref:HSF-type DNA-binding domain-containing protein n=1 Tax=Saprolegnia diclina (strain VS20) TaxID=1156394 RepID=T0QMC6_SAPDV|nr:hypothetical protein SDRG_03454 [Saprolegnia diclina VS20]EQC39249.1 hypothetical protein SDRG_03454 [Saprolegnia diclina VS20]|eukprot:XP_008607310.1 hypothetical protein SDRG_03454 [Saprolegnia diclina VS20]
MSPTGISGIVQFLFCGKMASETKPTSASFTTVVAPFLASLYEILSKEDASIVGWCDDGKSFIVHDYDAMERDILPTYFRHNKFASFQRQLNYFGFRKLHKAKENDTSSTYSQPFFIKSDPSRMLQIKRKTQRLKTPTAGSTPSASGRRPSSASTPSSSSSSDFSFYNPDMPAFTRSKSMSDPMLYHMNYAPSLSRSSSNPTPFDTAGYDNRPHLDFDPLSLESSPFLSVHDHNSYDLRPTLDMYPPQYTPQHHHQQSYHHQQHPHSTPMHSSVGVDTRMAMEMSSMKMASWADVRLEVPTTMSEAGGDIQPIPFQCTSGNDSIDFSSEELQMLCDAPLCS